MVQYSCEQCNKTFDHKTNFTKHLKMHENRQATEQNGIKCGKCEKMFKCKYSLKIHTENHCKHRINNALSSAEAQNFAVQNELARMRSELNQIKQLITTSSDNKQINIQNTIVNINYINIQYINPFGNERSVMDTLSDKQLEHIAQQGGNAVSKLVQYKHYNKNIPENHSILLNRQKDDVAMVFDGLIFKEMSVDDIISILITRSKEDICNILDKTQASLDSNQKRNINRLIKKLNENNPDTKAMLDEDLRKIMCDNKDLVIATFNNIINMHKNNQVSTKIEDA
jgi:hypothetical protein